MGAGARARAAASVLVCLHLVCTPAAAKTPVPMPTPRMPDAAAPYRIDKPSVALGEALTLTLSRPLAAPGPALEALDLSPLTHDFEIQGSTRGSDGTREDLTLTLYPRRLGRIELPRWGLPGKPTVVEVTAGSDKVPLVKFQFRIDPPELLARQSALLTLEACDDGTLQWRRPAITVRDGYGLRALNETEIITTRDGQRCTAHRWHWALLPTAPGWLRVLPPVLQASKFGAQLRFPAPTFEVKVAPVPSWLPAEVAIGPVKFGSAAAASAPTGVVGQPLPWRFVVTGDFGAQALRELVRAQLAAYPAWAHYPPTVQLVPGFDVAPRHEVTLYGLPRERGGIEQPALQLPWFDPAQGALRQAELPARRIEVGDPAGDRIIRLLWISAGVLAGGLVVVWVGRGLAWRVRRWRFARAVRRCASLDELHRAVLGFSLAGATAPAPTLHAWQERMEAQSLSQGLPTLVDALAQARYGRDAKPDAPVVSALTSVLLMWLRSVRRCAKAQRETSPATARNDPSGSPEGSPRSTARATPEPDGRKTP